mgnify:FL=1|tara:strand:- start:5755 stop:6516 length:762 start_codon:yes stop_codon:yes gene_type:complete
MKTFKKYAVAAGFAGSLATFPALAAEPDLTAEHIGFGSGVITGALIAGPLGAIIGGSLGIMIGHDQVQKSELDKSQLQIEQERARVSLHRSDLVAAQGALEAVNSQLAEKGDALQQAQDRLQGLQERYAALQGLVSGLRLSVYFEQNSSQVHPRDQALLESVGQGAEKVEGLVVDLEGHANKSGLDQYNEWLSEQRSDRVGGVLMAQGVVGESIRRQAQGARQASSLRVYAPEERRVDLMFSFEPVQGLVSLD